MRLLSIILKLLQNFVVIAQCKAIVYVVQECSLNRACDSVALSQRLVDSLATNAYFKRCVKQPGFIVRHYAEPVTYFCDDLLEKNKVSSMFTEHENFSKIKFDSQKNR